MPKGITCPQCLAVEQSQVYDSRPTVDTGAFSHGARWRRRKCLKCKNRFTSIELVASAAELRLIGQLLEMLHEESRRSR